MPPTWMLGFLPSMGAGKASFCLFPLQDHKAISEVLSAGKKYLQNTINNRQNSAVLGSSGGSMQAAGSRGSPAPSHCSGHTPDSPFSTPQMLPGYFFHIHLAQVEAGTGEHLSHRLVGGHSARKSSQTSSWHGKGWRKGKKIPAAGLRPKRARTDGKAGSLPALCCCEDNARVLQSHCCFPLHLQLEIAPVFPASPRVLSLQVPGPLPPPVAGSFSPG